VLYGGTGSTTLVGGSGVSQLIAGTGPDTFELDGTGTTTIFGAKQDDVIRFGPGITLDDVTLTPTLYDDGSTALVIDAGGSATLVGAIGDGVDAFRFDDGTVLSRTQLMHGGQMGTLDLAGNGHELLVSNVDGEDLRGTDTTYTAFAYGDGSVVHAASGSSTLVGGGADITYAVETLESHTVVRSSAADDVLQLTVANADDVQLVPGRGFQELRFGASGSVRVEGTPAQTLQTVQFADGTRTTMTDLATRNGVRFDNPDGSYGLMRQDSHGNVTVAFYSSTGAKQSRTWSRADGSSGSDTYRVDGSSTGTVRQSDGSTATYEDDGRGMLTTQLRDARGTFTGSTVATTGPQGRAVTTYDANGAKLSTTWTRADGSHGTDVFAADGSASGTAVGADGTQVAYSDDGKGLHTERHLDPAGALTSTVVTRTDAAGNVTTTNADAAGATVSDTWRHPDGAHGGDFFNADGSSSGYTYAPDGSYTTYVDDGKGTTSTTAFNAAGVAIGVTTTTPADSGSVRTDNPDGTYVVRTGSGSNLTWTTYSAAGVKLSDSWSRADGSSGGDVFQAGGVVTGRTYRPDGSYAIRSSDGSGVSTEAFYDVNGNKTGGTYTLTNAGVQSITEQFDANGRLIGETWRHADGRTGSGAAGARDMFGLQFGATMVTFGKADTPMNGVTIRIPQDTPTARMGAEAEMFITVDGVAGASYSMRGFNPVGSPTRTTLEMYDALTGIVFTGTDTTTAGTSWRFSQKGKESLYLDGFGNGVMTGYASDGHRVSDMWFHNDGSTGYTFYGADGSWHGQVVDVHGVVTTVDSGGVVGQEGPTSVGDPTGTGVAPDAPTPSAPAQLGAAATAPVTHDDRSAVVGVGYVEPTHTFSRVDGKTVDSVVTPLGSAVVSVNGVVAATVDTDPGYSLQRSIDGKTYRWNYDPAGILLARTVDDGNGVTTTETLDAAGRLTGSSLTIAVADGSVRTVQYDAADRVVGSSTTTVAGTVTTTLLYDAVGAAIGSRVTTSDGAGSSGTIVYDAAGNVSASSRVEVLAPGTVRITQFDASGAQTGAYMMAVDTAGNITTSNYDAAGRLTGSVAAMPNTDGAYRTGNYDAAGKLTSSTVLGFDGDSTVLSVYDAHGTLLRSSAVGPDAVLTSSDNAGATVQYRPDGSSDVTHDDGRGNREVISYSSGHVMTTRAWQQSDGSHGTDRYEPDGRVTGDAVAADGSRSTFVTDTAGTRTTTRWSDVGAVLGTTVTAIVDGASRTTFYGADGAPQSARWSEADGTTVNVIYVADGGRTETRQIADGTSSVMTDDAKGNVETLFYDAAKHKTKRIWKHADGAYGNDLFDAYGASVGHAVNADGSTVDSTDDAHGNTSWIKKSAAGVEIERGWHYADGTQKTLWSPGDSMTHVKEQAADGTYVIRVFDTLGNLFVTNYDAAGNETTESWQTPDGAHGSGVRDSDGTLRTYAWDASGRYTRFTMVRPDGSTYVTLFHPDGGSDSTDTTVPDAHGIVTATSTYFGAGGMYLGHATGLSDGHGNNTLQRWDASDVLVEQRWTRSDGTSGTGDGLLDQAPVTDADGRRLVRRVNVFGVVTSDTWTREDGSHGSDTFRDDGTTEGTAIRPDGSHRDYVNGANGDTRWTDYDAAGHALAGYHKYSNGQFSGYTNTYTGDSLSGDTWYQSDGSYGSDRYEPDGSSSGSNYSAPDATTYFYTINTDNVAFYNYTAPDGRHGTSTWYPDGSNSSTDYAVDQTYTTTVNDAAGNSMVTYFDQYGYKLRDTWTHADGSTGSDVFEPNRAPVAVAELTPQRAQEASPFSYVLPTALFSDPDEGEVLGYSIRGADGTAPPDWLHFDPATMTLSGTPAAGSAGALQLQVVATDRGGLTGIAPIEIDIDAPRAATALQSDGSARVATAALIESVLPDGQVVPTFDAAKFAQAYAQAQVGETVANRWAITDTLLAAHLRIPAMGAVEMAYFDAQRAQTDGIAVATGAVPRDASAGMAGPNGSIWSGVRLTPGALA
jgi:YD repeat-containing protein